MENINPLHLYGFGKYKELAGFSGSEENLARVISQDKHSFRLVSKMGETNGILRAKSLKETALENLPKIGDFVEIAPLPEKNKVVILNILPRYSALKRTDHFHHEKIQILGANVDGLVLVFGINQPQIMWNVERFMALSQNIETGIVINKLDLKPDGNENLFSEIKEKFPKATLFPLSAENGQNLNHLNYFLKPGLTYAFFGPSGAGKSSIINILVGQNLFKTSALGKDKQGRHTTTQRIITLAQNGAILIDAPGLRETGKKEDSAFTSQQASILGIANHCKFSKCDHQKTAGCAILEALKKGKISPKDYRHFIFVNNKQEKTNNIFRKKIQKRRETFSREE